MKSVKILLTLIALTLNIQSLWFEPWFRGKNVCNHSTLPQYLTRNWEDNKLSQDEWNNIKKALRFIMLERRKIAIQPKISNEINKWGKILPETLFKYANEEEKQEIYKALSFFGRNLQN